MKDDQLEEKVINIFSQLNVSISKSDIEDSHELGKSNTVVKLINHKLCKDALGKSLSLINAMTIQSLASMLRINFSYVRT